VRNTDNRFGLMGGISGNTGLRVSCLKSIVLAVEFQADFSLLFKNKYWPDMSLYRAGFTKSYLPHLRLEYSF